MSLVPNLKSLGQIGVYTVTILTRTGLIFQFDDGHCDLDL